MKYQPEEIHWLDARFLPLITYYLSVLLNGRKHEYNKRSEIVMPYELFNQSTTISRKLSRQFWKKTLELARMYGWRPMGTQAPSYHDSNRLNADWHGTYLSNEGQTVLREDAIAMAEALQKSLDDIPDFNGEVDWNPKFWVDDDLPDWLSPDEKETIEDGIEEEFLDIIGIHPFEFFAGDEKRRLIALIRFCKLGSFTIL